MRYIYLNSYSYKGNVLLYVGSHSWSGGTTSDPVDPSYKGSSKVAIHYGWIPVSIEVIEVITDASTQLKRESYWIERFCKLNGIADVALAHAHNNSWVSKFASHGLMLNLHSNSCEQATIAAASPASRRKAVFTMRNKGTYSNMKMLLNESQLKARATKSINFLSGRGAVSPIVVIRDGVVVYEGILKKFLIDNGFRYSSRLSSRIFDGIRTKGSFFLNDFIIKKSSASFIQGTLISAIDTNSLKEFNVYNSSDELICSGSAHHCCKVLSNPNWCVSVCRKSKVSKCFLHHSYKFVVIASKARKSSFRKDWKPSQRVRCSDGFIGDYKSVASHFSMKASTIAVLISRAHKFGECLIKRLGVILYPV